jgi:hypothetical protein
MTRRTSTTIRLSHPVRRRRCPDKPSELPPQRGPEPTTVYLRRDQEGWWVVTCSYHRRFLTALRREVPNKRYCHETKTWRVAPNSFPLLREVLHEFFERIIVVRRKGPRDVGTDSKVRYVEPRAIERARTLPFDRVIDEDEDEQEVRPEDLEGLEDKVKVQE